MYFEQEKHQKLWYLLAERIEAAARKNYSGTGYYSAYSEIEKLKRRLLQDNFEEDDREIRNLCFACNTALEEQQSGWYYDFEAELDCRFCPLKWTLDRYCDDNHSLYSKLVDALETDDAGEARRICIEIANVKAFTEKEYERKIPKNPCW